METPQINKTIQSIERLTESLLNDLKEEIKHHYYTNDYRKPREEGWAEKARNLWMRYENSTNVFIDKAKAAYLKGADKTVTLEGVATVTYQSGEIYNLSPRQTSLDPRHPVSIWLDHPDQPTWTAAFSLKDVVLIDFDIY
jgi:hypothetical protein